MRIGIISDIHGNLEALERVMDDMSEQGVDRVVCLGDVVGYGPYPAECLGVVRNMTELLIMGNHEDSVVNPAKGEDRLNELALAGVRYTRRQLSPENLAAIRAWPERVVLPELDLALAHGSYSEPSAWNYVFGEGEAESESAHVPARICLLGHTHRPMIFSSIGGLADEQPERRLLRKKRRYLVNVGSVGQPRDGDSRASYALLEFANQRTSLILRRVGYDIGKTAAAIRQAGLPERLAARLFGGW